MNIDFEALFERLYPGFFQAERIRALPEGQIYEELAMPLVDFPGEGVCLPAPLGIDFGLFRGDHEALREAVRRVNPGWAAYFVPSARVYCGFDGGRVVSFCILEDLGTFAGLRIGGPGCVGTLRECRRQGIGLKMVENATRLLRDEGFDLGYIHYTGLAAWYGRLGYRPVLRWNRAGIMR